MNVFLFIFSSKSTHLVAEHVVPEGETLVTLAGLHLLGGGEAGNGALLHVRANDEGEEDSGSRPHIGVGRQKIRFPGRKSKVVPCWRIVVVEAGHERSLLPDQPNLDLNSAFLRNGVWSHQNPKSHRLARVQNAGCLKARS